MQYLDLKEFEDFVKSRNLVPEQEKVSVLSFNLLCCCAACLFVETGYGKKSTN